MNNLVCVSFLLIVMYIGNKDPCKLTIEENTEDKETIAEGGWIFAEGWTKDPKYLEKEVYKKIKDKEETYRTKSKLSFIYFYLYYYIIRISSLYNSCECVCVRVI